MDTIEWIRKNKIIVIVRGTYGDELMRLARALYDGGGRLMEVTFDQRDPACLEKTGAAIAALQSAFGDAMSFGAGTVLTGEQVDAAAQAGGRFIIEPNVSEKVIARTREKGLVSIPGAMTPTEILHAHELGADFVKLFPAAALGARYIKDILTPISHVGLIATAGVNEENFGEFLRLGMVGAGISGRLTDKKLIASGDWAELTRRMKTFVKIADDTEL